MMPFLRQGDTVSISPGQGCQIGDTVLYRAGEALVLHRVVIKKDGRIISKGDALGRLDAPVTPEQILGRAVARERGGWVRPLDTFGQRWIGLAFSFTVPLVPGLIPLLARVMRGVRAILERVYPQANVDLIG